MSIDYFQSLEEIVAPATIEHHKRIATRSGKETLNIFSAKLVQPYLTIK
jgi:hypothetical protein